jgi:hypothetical protein
MINFELGNSCPPIPTETWINDGVLPQILGSTILQRRLDMGVRDAAENPPGAEELIGILTELADESEA